MICISTFSCSLKLFIQRFNDMGSGPAAIASGGRKEEKDHAQAKQ